MDTKLMTETARAMVAQGKGLLAADESAGTCKKRFDSVKVECTEENRRAYRELLFTTLFCTRTFSASSSNSSRSCPTYFTIRG